VIRGEGSTAAWGCAEGETKYWMRWSPSARPAPRREVEVATALPDAEVAVLGCTDEASQMVQGSSCLLDVGRVVFGNVGVCFRLPGLVGSGMKRSRA
jgi:hypothetical protein